MTEVDDYKKRVKTMSYAELIEQNEKWAEQRKNATGEYGYWGGVTGSEIVDKELATRTGKTYLVEEVFVDNTGRIWEQGEVLKQNQIPSEMLNPLEQQSFIKEIER